MNVQRSTLKRKENTLTESSENTDKHLVTSDDNNNSLLLKRVDELNNRNNCDTASNISESTVVIHQANGNLGKQQLNDSSSVSQMSNNTTSNNNTSNLTSTPQANAKNSTNRLNESENSSEPDGAATANKTSSVDTKQMNGFTTESKKYMLNALHNQGKYSDNEEEEFFDHDDFRNDLECKQTKLDAYLNSSSSNNIKSVQLKTKKSNQILKYGGLFLLMVVLFIFIWILIELWFCSSNECSYSRTVSKLNDNFYLSTQYLKNKLLAPFNRNDNSSISSQNRWLPWPLTFNANQSLDPIFSWFFSQYKSN